MPTGSRVGVGHHRDGGRGIVLGRLDRLDRDDERAAHNGPAATTGQLPAGLDATIVSVTDGDTVKARIGTGVTERGPAHRHRYPGDQGSAHRRRVFGAEASARTHSLLPAKTPVRLELDVEPRDRYGRLLAYVWRVDDGLFVNEALVRDGWAAPYRYPPNVKYADRFSGSAPRPARPSSGCGERAVARTHRPAAARRRHRRRRRHRSAVVAIPTTRAHACRSRRPTSTAATSPRTVSRWSARMSTVSTVITTVSR